ncbi:uncharacterized protein METZ01_LOCUS36983 [marine metagenome]|uniref:Uncharacterized protein n=1 Tax=marine metagenome TaxID=408172 RepID=A0A381QZT7_9ZZZZ
MKSTADDFWNPIHIFNLLYPLGGISKHCSVINFLKCFTPGRTTLNLTNEHHQRCRVLGGDMNT